MPELPEVESVRLGLEKYLIGAKILSFSQLHPRVLSSQSLAPLNSLKNYEISAIKRRGKFLWFEFHQPKFAKNVVLVGHLGMSGQFRVIELSKKKSKKLNLDVLQTLGYKHARAVATLVAKGKHYLLIFNDQRTFGWLRIDQLRDLQPESIRHIAPDLFDLNFNQVELIEKMQKRKSEVKRALLDQSLISGIGNIYADESLWKARIHPAHPCSELSKSQWRILISSTKTILEKAIKAGGTSFDALYLNVNGQSGYFENSLTVYGREDQECFRCQTPIRRIKFTNRSSHLCPHCQRYCKA